MKYCLSCCFIRAEDCCWFYEDYCCKCGSTHIVDDGLTREQYEQMTEDEKDEYEVKIQLEVENSPYFNEKSYKELALGNPDFWFGFRYDKYTRLTGNKKAGQKLTPEEEAEEKRKFEESMRGAEADYYFNLGKQKREEQENANKPKCPTCGSTNIKKMGGIERGASIAAFGLFSKKINKTFKCSNCGYTW